VKRLRALVVDDEEAGRRELMELLARAGVHRVAQAESSADALALLTSDRFDALFLDIHMPGLDGMGLLRAMSRLPSRPQVVLVTADPSQAVQAFSESVLDYLVKPVALERLERTLGRLARSSGASLPHRKVPVDRGDRIVLMDPAEIRYVQAREDVAYVATQDGMYRTRFTLTELERRLGGGNFVRVHRSFLVNVDHVVEVRPFFQGTYVLRVDDRQRSEVPVSRREAQKLRELLGL
jgi:two-component system response regulator LytT